MKGRGVEEYKAQIRCFIRKEKKEEQSAWLRLHMSVKEPTDTVTSPVHRLFSSLTMSESVVHNIITASLYPEEEEEERMKIMKGLCLVMVKRERERTRTWMLLLLLWVEKTELEMIIGNESNSETEIVSSESGKASQLSSCKRLRKRDHWLRQQDRSTSPEPSIHHHCLIQFNTRHTRRNSSTNRTISQSVSVLNN